MGGYRALSVWRYVQYRVEIGRPLCQFYLHTDFIHSSTTTFLYIRSVLNVNLIPLVTSAPECSRSRCWKISTLPILGSTSNWRSIFMESTQMRTESALPLRMILEGFDWEKVRWGS